MELSEPSLSSFNETLQSGDRISRLEAIEELQKSNDGLALIRDYLNVNPSSPIDDDVRNGVFDAWLIQWEITNPAPQLIIGTFQPFNEA